MGGLHSYVKGSENPYILQKQFEGCIRKRLETTGPSLPLTFFLLRLQEGMNKKRRVAVSGSGDDGKAVFDAIFLNQVDESCGMEDS